MYKQGKDGYLKEIASYDLGRLIPIECERGYGYEGKENAASDNKRN